MANCLWDTWTCHSLSNIEVCANASSNISKHQPAGKRLKKSTLAASTLACYVFICTNLEQTRNTRPISQFTMAGTLQVAKLWHAGFSYVQTSSKPCSNLKSMGPDHASRCDRILKESSKFLFLRAAKSAANMKTQQKGVVWLFLRRIWKHSTRRCRFPPHA